MRNIFILIHIISLSGLHAQESFLKYCDFNAPYSEVYDIDIINNEIFGTGFGWDTTIIPPKQLFYILKADIQANILDYKFYHNEDTSMYAPYASGPLYFPCLLTVDNSNFIVVFFNLTKGLEIFKFDTDLRIINKNSVPSSSQNTGICPIKMFKLNNCIYLAGYESISSTKYQSYLFKYDNELKLKYKALLPNIEKIRSFEYDSIQNEFIFSQRENGKDKIVVTDTALNQIKLVEQSISMKEVIFMNIVSTDNNNYLLSNSDVFGNDVTGYKFSKNISHFDQDFNKVWTFSMGGLPDMMTAVANIVPSSDDAYFAYGQVGARTADIRDIYSSLDSINIMILSTVKFREDGKILWQRFDTLEIGYYNISYAKSGGMAAADDGGIYVSGDVTCYDTIRIDGELKRRTNYKHFLMKIDSNGCVDGLHCNVEPKTETVLSATPGLTAADSGLRIYPNPGNGRVTITRDEHTRPALLTVYTAQGVPLMSRKVDQGTEEIQLDLSGKPPGRYYVTVRQEGGKMAKASFIIHR